MLTKELQRDHQDSLPKPIRYRYPFVFTKPAFQWVLIAQIDKALSD